MSDSMEHTHLISVCVFCLLCATHIHCSEYSTRASRTKIKSKAENSGRNAIGASKGTEDAFPTDRENPFGYSSLLQDDSVPSRKDLLPSSDRPDRRYKRNDEQNRGGNKTHAELLFDKYKNSDDKIDLNGLKKMLNNLRLNNYSLEEHLPGIDGAPEAVETQKHRGGDGKEIAERSKSSIKAEEHEPDEGKCLSAEDLVPSPSHNSKSEVKGSRNSTVGGGTFSFSSWTKDDFAYNIKEVCPLLLLRLVEPHGCKLFGEHGDGNLKSDRFSAWLYSTIGVVLISLCGLLGVFVIPIMGNKFYNQLLQFLVALAVGTLCGDALLHLLPHAMIPHAGEDEEAVHRVADDGHDHDHGHTVTMWKGLAVLLGIVFFFLTEKFLNLGSEWRKKRQRNNKVRGHSHVQIMNGNEESGDSVREKLCKHKYSSYPYCYPDIKSNKDGHEHTARTNNAGDVRKAEYRDQKPIGEESFEKWSEESQRLTRATENESGNDDEARGTEATADAEKETEEKQGEKGQRSEGSECGKKDGEYTVIIREHETVHHGHSHAHGHVHSPPESLSSVAWMVILGDGLHNFTDGMAVGAAFSNNIAGGCSTAVAVFCHELPHELGDFAVLLKAGMSAKQAVFYNLMSSILCFVGMCLGILVGDNPDATSWVFAVSAGMFLYIGLVDMFPELTTSHSAIESSLCQCLLQVLGLISGVAIMLVIAYYEDHLLNLFK